MEYVLKHFKDVCVSASFSDHVIGVFPRTGCNSNTVFPVNRETRLDRKDYWIKTHEHAISLI